MGYPRRQRSCVNGRERVIMGVSGIPCEGVFYE